MAFHLHAAQYLLVTKPAGGEWSVRAVEAVQINGKDKVRTSAVSANRPAKWDAKSASRLPESALSAFAAVRRSTDGNFWAKAGAAREWILLLPDGIKSKAADAAAAHWRAATIAVRKDRADKTISAIRSEDLYAILPGLDAGASAARLATDDGVHKAPGVDDAQAFRNAAELTPAVVREFPSSPATERVREHLRAEMESRLQKWTAGDALRTVLDEGLLLAVASETAFPQDGALKTLRGGLRNEKQRLDHRIAVLRALNVGGQPDAFLVAYREFEPFDRSYPDLFQMRRKQLEASALAHVGEAQRLRKSGDYVGAIRHLLKARLRSPDLADAARLLEQVRLEVARLSSQQYAERRRGIDPRSPAKVQVERRLSSAEQYIADSKANEAEKALEEAETIDKDEPRTKLVEANLAVLRGELGMALALLDLYAGMATTTQDFNEGEKLRAAVLYKIENQRTQTRTQLKNLFSSQRFATALTSAVDGLKVDNEEPSFLYHAGVNACLLRHCSDAAPFLRRFLELTDSTTASREQRIAAVRLLLHADGAEKPARRTGKVAEVNWFSGEPLERGIFYDPISLTFQPKVARITASDHLSVNYDWKGNVLQSVHTKHEEKKTASNMARLALGVGMAAGGGIGTVNWKTAERETNDFYFNYYDDAAQVFNVNRDNQVVKSRTIPIMIPGMGGFGAFGGLASLSLGRMGSLGAGMGASSWSGLIATASTLKRPGGLVGLTGTATGYGPVPTLTNTPSYSVHGDPQGGASSGYLTLWNNPRIDTGLAYIATGKRVAVGFSGNHFFHPFGWDCLHLFELDYDAEGRVMHAWELDQPNPPRLDFQWDGRRLMSVTARENTPAANVIYTRTLGYSEIRLLEETIAADGKTSHIRYKYDKQGRLVEAECTEDASLDGRSRKVEFLVDSTEKGKD
jgi:YD repeat-containing protein